MAISVNKLMKRAKSSFSGIERENQESRWRLISEFIMPTQSGIFQNNDSPGIKKTTRLFDSEAIQANYDLGAAIHTSLTNPSTRWSKIRFKEEFLNNDSESVMWLEQVNKIIHDKLNESNFDMQVSQCYQSLPALGNMILFHDTEQEDPGQFRFKSLHLAEVAFEENHKGEVDTVYRKFRMTYKQIVEKWPDVSDGLKQKADTKPDERVEIYHCVYKRDESQVNINSIGLASPKDRPYASVYMLDKEELALEEGGFYEFPFYVVRWGTLPGEVYGRGPGEVALPTVRSLNKLKELELVSVAKAVNPPIIATQRGVLGQLNLRPGEVSVVRDVNSVREWQTQARLDITQFNQQDMVAQIRRIFFLDKLQLPPRNEIGEMTAMETQIRTQQMQMVIGPTLSRLNSEFLQPLIIRCFQILQRAGELPELPDVLKEFGVNVEIVFVNPLARSQRIEEVTAIQSWLQDLGLLAQIKPEVVDLINEDGVARHIAKIRGVPEVAVQNDKDVEAIRQQRAQQQQQQQIQDAMVSAADIVSKSGGALGGQ